MLTLPTNLTFFDKLRSFIHCFISSASNPSPQIFQKNGFKILLLFICDNDFKTGIIPFLSSSLHIVNKNTLSVFFKISFLVLEIAFSE